MPRFVPLGDSMIEIIRAAKLVGLVGDVQPIGSPAQAGTSGRYADAAHRHPGIVLAAGALSSLTINWDHGAGTPLQFTDTNALPLHAWILGPGVFAGLGFNFYDATVNAVELAIGANIGATSQPGIELPQNQAVIRLHDATAGKWIRASGGQLQVINEAFGQIIWTLDDTGNLTLPVASSWLKFQDASATPYKFLRASGGTFFLVDSANANVLLSVTDAGLVSIPRAGGGLAVGAGAAIPAIFVQAATPTEIDGALWFQG